MNHNIENESPNNIFVLIDRVANTKTSLGKGHMYFYRVIFTYHFPKIYLNVFSPMSINTMIPILFECEPLIEILILKGYAQSKLFNMYAHSYLVRQENVLHLHPLLCVPEKGRLFGDCVCLYMLV